MLFALVANIFRFFGFQCVLNYQVCMCSNACVFVVCCFGCFSGIQFISSFQVVVFSDVLGFRISTCSQI